MRLPLQGGLPPVDAVDGAVGGAVVEVACDESGFSGSNLLYAAMPVITHASVDLSVAEAAELIAAVRSRFRFSPHEFKSGRFLRGASAGEPLEWLLDALRGRAYVHLVDKERFLATRIVDLFLAEPSYAAGTRLAREHDPAARALHDAHGRGGDEWRAFLTAFVDLVRGKRRRHPDPQALDRFFQARDALARAGVDPPAAAVLAALDPARVRAVLARLCADDPDIPPPLEPMLPALAETVLFWSGGVRRVLVIHDEQSALTAGRLARLQRALADAAGLPPAGSVPAGSVPAGSSPAGTSPAGTSPAGTGAGGAAPARVSPLAGLVVVDSRDDPRVQVADLLAGIARRLPGILGARALAAGSAGTGAVPDPRTPR